MLIHHPDLLRARLAEERIDMLQNKLVDGIVPEPLGGAHHNPQAAYDSLKSAVLSCLAELADMDAEDRIQARIAKFSAMGVVVDA